MKRVGRLGRWSVAWLVLVAAAGCSKPDETAVLSSARSYIERKDHVSAIIELKSLLQDKPESAEGRFLLGSSLLATGEAAAAEAELRRAMEYGMSKERVLPPLATAMLAVRKQAELVEQYGQLELQDDQAAADLKAHLALAYAEGGDLRKADDAVAAALRRVPTHMPSLLMRARLAAARGDIATAIGIADQLLAQDQNSAQAWSLKGDLLLQNKADPAAARAAYRKAIELQDNWLPAHQALMRLLIGQPDLAAAAKQLDLMKKVLPQNPQTLYFDALLAFLNGDAKRTREITQQLLSGSPNDPRVLLLAGQAELRLNSLIQAEALLGKAVSAAPKAPEPRLQLAQALLRHGQADQALIALQPLVDMAAPDAKALALAGQAHLAMGNFKNADASFARATRLKPEDPGIRTAKALSQLVRGPGQEDAALAELQAIATADTGNVAADLALISARLRRNELDAAAKAVDALAAKQPKQALPDHLRGRIAQQKGDLAAARRHFERALAKDARYFPAVRSLAELDLRDQQPQAARGRFETLLQADPNNASAMLALAELALRSGDKAEVVADWLDKAIKANPRNAGVFLAAINLQMLAGNGKA
ncbi:MAG TPA: XrtA/PEP-CTERM system TPR-repeat protein PrsT, partial [Roseateles sp.]|nr:XrtA/PEP-CTERM system TPR-repeat protein PrsT [Roseateles sp.]